MRTNRVSRHFSVWLGATAALAIASSATAQTANAESAEAQAERGGLEEITVTARRRAESAQDIPVAITALSGAAMQRMDITNLEKVAAMTPQLQVGRSAVGSGAQLTMRGIGSNSSSVGIEQSVAVIVDGAYYGNGRIINEGFFDLERLELLKGPQALFFGKNATAGVISITTANPTREFFGSSRIGLEVNAAQLYGEQILSGPLTSTLSGRVAVRLSRMFRGYTKGLATDQPYTTRDLATGNLNPHIAPAGPIDSPGERELVGRVSLMWEPTADFTAILKVGGTINKSNNPAWNNNIFSCPGGFSQLQPNVPCRRDWFAYHNGIAPTIAAVFPLAGDGRLRSEYESIGVNTELEYRMDNLTLSAIINYNWSSNLFVGDSDYQQAVGQIFVTEKSPFRAFSTELRALTSFDGPFNLMAGFLFQDTRRDYDQNVAAGNLEDSRKAPKDRYVSFGKESFTDGRTLSPYVQATLKVVPNVEIAGGVRYTHETKDSLFVQDTANLGNYVVGVPVIANQVFNDWSPEASVTWKPTEDLTIYGAYRTAYKSGGFSNSSALLVTSRPQDLSFNPEKARGFEIGIKGTLLDNQLRFDLTGYTFLYRNLQIDFFNGQTFAFITTNAGSARTRGIELQGQFAPRGIEGLNINGSINYNRARYVDFIAPCYNGQSIAAGCNSTAFGGLGQNLSGVPTSVAPEWTGALAASYDTMVSRDVMAGFSVNGRYSSSYLGSPFGNPFTEQPRYVALDALLRLYREDERWQVALIGKNLTNQFWITGALDGSATGFGTGTNNARPSDQRGFSNVPRTVQLQVTLRY